jgi:hypothetical protein
LKAALQDKNSELEKCFAAVLQDKKSELKNFVSVAGCTPRQKF